VLVCDILVTETVFAQDLDIAMDAIFCTGRKVQPLARVGFYYVVSHLGASDRPKSLSGMNSVLNNFQIHPNSPRANCNVQIVSDVLHLRKDLDIILLQPAGLRAYRQIALEMPVKLNHIFP